LLEEYEFAKKRGANILGEVIGFACNNNGGDLILPNLKRHNQYLSSAWKTPELILRMLI